MRERYKNISGIILRRSTTPNGDMIVSLLTPRGKFKGVSRKAAPSPSTLKLNLFQHVTVQIYHRQQEDLGLLTQVKLEGALSQLVKPEVYPLASFLCELVDHVVVGEMDIPQTYDLLAGALRGLNSHDDPEWVALVMAFKLLGSLGMAHRTEDPQGTFFDADRGVLTSKNSGIRLSADSAAFLASVHNRTVRDLMEHPQPNRKDLWMVLEKFIVTHAGILKSFEVLRSVQ
ncbi:DNA repair protein RecO [Deinococcus roseus]|uniref:DNA repair protein RecO n=1 Tax=Deinococcus roseus TaxID=392414 RepID=A0ABQ2CZ93_9DEIO|nr:DNA repair protein RecO [Deinococcus roseus]GGJ24414.1 DNA repair protein RecO [Deinococcus roseus]